MHQTQQGRLVVQQVTDAPAHLSRLSVNPQAPPLRPRRCDSGNLNGHYYNGPYRAMTDDGVVWYTWHGWWYSIKSVVMMVRAADLQQRPTETTTDGS